MSWTTARTDEERRELDEHFRACEMPHPSAQWHHLAKDLSWLRVDTASIAGLSTQSVYDR